MIDFPGTVKANIPKEMINSLRVARKSIVLDETDLKEVQRDVGGTIGNRGISDNQPLLMRHNGRVVVGD